RRAPAAGDSGAWYRIARSVMRRPVAYIVVIVIALLALGSRFRSIPWGGTDARALPAGSAPRVVTEALARDFPVNATTPIEAVVKFAGPVSAPAERAALASYAARLGQVPGVIDARVTGAAGAVAKGGPRFSAHDGSPAARGLGDQAGSGPRPARGARLRGRRHRGTRGRTGQSRRDPAVDGPAGGGHHVRPAVPRLRLGGAAGQGHRDERALAHRRVRRDRVDLPGGPP